MTASLDYKRAMRGSRAAALLLTCAAAAAVSADYVRPAPQTHRSGEGHLPLHLEAIRRRRAGRQRRRHPLQRRRARLRLERHARLVGRRARRDPAAHRQAGEIRRQLALALGSLVRDRDLHARVPGREGGRAREDARDDGGAGDRVQPPRPRIRAPGLRRRRSKRRSPTSRSSSRCWTRIGSSSSRSRKRTWSCRGRRSRIACRFASASAGSRFSTTTARSRRATPSYIFRRKGSSSPAICW